LEKKQFSDKVYWMWFTWKWNNKTNLSVTMKQAVVVFLSGFEGFTIFLCCKRKLSQTDASDDVLNAPKNKAL